jgi:thiol-disulfide isomerase/thioredoxin
MKAITFFFTLLCSITSLFGQHSGRAEPFVIKGQLRNCSEKYIQILFEGKKGQRFIETVSLDKAGNFYLKTFKIKQPQKAILAQNNDQLTTIFVAPGYALTIVGNCRDIVSLIKTKQITGIGMESNRYLLTLDSILYYRADGKDINLYKLNDSQLLAHVQNERKLKDSVADYVFKRKSVQDKYLKYFEKVVRLDNSFAELYRLLIHANYSIYENEKSVAFVRNNFDTEILDNISRDEYLSSETYLRLIGGEYLKYLLNMDYHKDSTLRNKKDHKLELISKVYTGQVREYVLQKEILSIIRFSESVKDLNEAKNIIESYISTISNNFYKDYINLKFSEKEKELLKTQVGKPAPEFSLENNFNKSFSLKDFKGKVVYIDLWASWCKPCRAETPFLNTMVAKYKNDNRIVFISIAVADKINNWLKALQEDKPQWIQLIDKDDFVWKSYVLSYSIPRFVLIDKGGNIVNFDSPRPSSGNEIEALIDQELIK